MTFGCCFSTVVRSAKVKRLIESRCRSEVCNFGFVQVYCVFHTELLGLGVCCWNVNTSPHFVCNHHSIKQSNSCGLSYNLPRVNKDLGRRRKKKGDRTPRDESADRLCLSQDGAVSSQSTTSRVLPACTPTRTARLHPHTVSRWKPGPRRLSWPARVHQTPVGGRKLRRHFRSVQFFLTTTAKQKEQLAC